MPAQGDFIILSAHPRRDRGGCAFERFEGPPDIEYDGSGVSAKLESLLDRHEEDWRKATRHPFLDGAGDGTLAADAFERWLVQDRLYVLDLLVFQARLLARTPRPAQGVVIGGLVALEAELTWFEGLARKRNFDLDAPHHPTAVTYRDLLTRLDTEPYAVGITALWAVERAYLEAWTSALPGHPDYREYVEHWTTPEFGLYVSGLETAAEAALETASDRERDRAEEAFLDVARLEKDFWEMAFAGDGR